MAKKQPKPTDEMIDKEATDFWRGVIYAIDTLRKHYRDSNLRGYCDLVDRAQAEIRKGETSGVPMGYPPDPDSDELVASPDPASSETTSEASAEEPEPTVKGKKLW